MNNPSRTGPHQPGTADAVAADQPQRIGRYRVEKLLGSGGFGLVYLAHDEQLQRPVTVRRRIAGSSPDPNGPVFSLDRVGAYGYV